MVTIQDVAKAAGVSPMTVSHVINEHRHVKESTRAKVLAAMNDLGYRVNVAARNLRTGRTDTIGLAVPEVDRPYWGQLGAAIISAAERHELRVVIEQTGRQRDKELNALSVSRNRLYDGLILSTVGLGPGGRGAAEGRLSRGDLGRADLRRSRRPCGDAECRGGACRDCALIERGVSPDRHRRGFLHGGGGRVQLAARGLPSGLRRGEDPVLLRLVVNCDVLSMQAGADAVRGLGARRRVRWRVLCDRHDAIGVLRGLADLGLDVPGQVKVIGFDDVAEAAFTVPSLSSVDPELEEIANKAVDLLVGRISGTVPAGSHEEFVTDYTIIARESTAA